MLDRGSEILSFLEERATDLNNGTANLNVGSALTKLGESGWFGYAIPELPPIHIYHNSQNPYPSMDIALNIS